MINDKLRFERNLGWDYSEVLENSEKN